MLKLPVEYPADAAGIIVTIYGEGSIADKKLELVEALWNLIGWTAWHEAKVDPKDTTYLFTLPESPSDAEVVAILKQFNDLPSHEKLDSSDKPKLPFSYEKMRVWAQTLLGRLI